MAKIREVLAEARAAAQSAALHLIEVDRTDYAIKLRLLIDRDIFVQIYANETSGKLNLALVLKGNRIYGFDAEGGSYHCHPFNDQFQHSPTLRNVTISEFIEESLTLLTEHGLL